MKYFDMKFIRQSSKHPDGEGEFSILIEGKTKKAAIDSAKQWLKDEHDPENHAFYRVPVATEITEEEYNAEEEAEEEETGEEEAAESGNPEDNETLYQEFDVVEDETPEQRSAREAAEKATAEGKKAELRKPEFEYLLFVPVPSLPILITIRSVVADDKFQHTATVKVVADGNGYIDQLPSTYENFQACVDEALDLVDDMLMEARNAHSLLEADIKTALEFMGDDTDGFIGRHRRTHDFAMQAIDKVEKCVITLSDGEVITALMDETGIEDVFMDDDEDMAFSDDDDDFNTDEFNESDPLQEGDAHLQVDLEEAIADQKLSEITVEKLNAMIAALGPDESFTLYNLDNDVYHKADGYSNSSLGIIAKDAGLLEWAKNAPRDTEKEKELNVGTAVHACVLEPDLYKMNYVVRMKINKATKEGKLYHSKFDSAREIDGLEELTEDEAKKFSLMAGSLRAHPKAAQLLSSGNAEVSLFWHDPDTGIVFKIRMDWLTKIGMNPVIFDVKTIDKPDQFEKSVEEFGYHRQDAFYSKVFYGAHKVAPVFCFGVMGKHINCGKYPVRMCLLDDSDKIEGLAKANAAIDILVECLKTDRWGGFELVTRPQWAKKNDIT